MTAAPEPARRSPAPRRHRPRGGQSATPQSEASLALRDAVADGSPEPASNLSGHQRVQAERRRGLPAPVVHEAIRREGEEELARPGAALAWSGLAAGLSMGFSLVAEGLLRAHLPDAPWRPLVSKLGYSVGFLIVVLGRQQLFTENTLTVILPLLTRHDRDTLGRVVRLWAIVLAANLVGALLFALVLAHTDVFDSANLAVFRDIGLASIAGAPSTILIRGMFAGWLIALMVWLLPAAESSRVWVILVLTYLVGLGGLAHVIAGSVETLFVTVSGAASPVGWIGWFLPTLAGNIVGGVSLVAALNHAQVVAGQGRGRQREQPDRSRDDEEEGEAA